MPQRIGYHGPANRPGATSRNAYESLLSRKADKRFYAAARWRSLRRLVLRDHPLCALCLAEGRHTAAEHVHHKLERKDRPDLAYDPDNLEALCEPCHGRARG